MHTDKDWDEIGKRLRDQESAPPPFAWHKIQKEIRPRRRHRAWLWIPLLLLVLVGVPVLVMKLPELRSGKPGVALTDEADKAVAATKQAKTLPAGADAFTEVPPVSAAVSWVEEQRGKPESGVTVSAKPSVAVAGTGRKNEKAFPFVFVSPAGKEKATVAGEKQRSESSAVTKEGSRNLTRTYSGSKKNSVSGLVLAKETEKVTKEDQQKLLNSKNDPAALHNAKVAANATEADKAADNALAQTGINPLKQLNADSSKVELADAEQVLDKPAPLVKADTTTELEAIALVAADTLTTEADSTSEEKNKDQKKRWSVAVYVAPQYAYRRVEANPNGELHVLSLHNKNKHFPERFGYETGVRTALPVSERLEIEGALTFSVHNERAAVTATTVSADSMVVQQSADKIVINAYTREQLHEYKCRYYFGGLYGGGNYTVLKRQQSKWQLTAGAGLNYLFDGKVINESANGNVASYSKDLRKLNGYISAGLRYTHAVSPNVELQLGPSVQYYLNSVMPDQELISLKPFTVGLQAGLRLSNGAYTKP